MLVSCLTVGVVSTDAARSSDSVGYSEYNLSSGQVFYFDNSATQWSSVKLQVMKKNNGNFTGGPWDLTQVSGSDYWKFTAPSAWNGYTHYLFYNGTWGTTNQTEDIEGQLATSSWYTNCFTPTANANAKWGGSFNKCVGVKNFAVTPSPVISGSGTSSSPYIVARNTSITLTASSDKIDNNYTTNYSFDGTNYSTTATSSFTSSNTGDYSFDKTVYVKTTRGSYSSTPVSKKVYFKTAPAETLYTVTVQSANSSQGSVSASSVQAGATTAVALPTATPAYGYKFKNWTTTSSSITITNATSASGATVKASAAGTVKANFEPNDGLSLYIAGRFHVQTTDTSGSWTNSFDSGDWSYTGDDNIPFTYVSNGIYKVETHASLADLSGNISGYAPYFYVYDKTNTKYWCRATAGTEFTTSNTSTTLTKYNTQQSTGINDNLRFNDSSTDKPVTLYFNVTTGALYYEVPNYYNVTCNTATGGSISASPTRAQQGTTITLTVSPKTGYTLSSLTVKDASNNTVSVSGSGNTRTFIMPSSNVTVTPTFSKISYTLTKATATNGSFTLSTSSANPASSATYGATVTVTCSPNDYYEVDTVTYKQTGSSGSGTTVSISNNSGTFTMPAYNVTVTVTFKEKLYDITVQTNNSSQGTVVRGTTTVSGSTTKIGYVTAVTLAATNKTGYQFDHWTITKGTATYYYVGSTRHTLTTTSEVTISDATASTAFKLNGTATLKAYFVPTDYSLSAKIVNGGNTTSTWNGNSVTTTDTSGNTKQSLHLNDLFEVRITLASGYAVSAAPTFSGGGTATLQSGYPTTSGSTVTYRYKLTAVGDLVASVTLKAATPTISGVQIKNTSFSFASYGNPTQNYYKQPTEVMATTESFATLGYNNTYQSVSGKTSGTAVSLTQPSITLNAEGATADYTLTITATNAPAGVTAVSVSSTYTIRVKFNDAQKKYFKLKQLYDNCIEESTSNNPYYRADAPISAYNTQYGIAGTYINAGYPTYNAGSAELAEATTKYDNFHAAYSNLMAKANTTTIYILSTIANSESNPMYIHAWSNNVTADWNHFKMYSYDYSGTYVTNDTYKMSYAGVFTYSGASKYLYKITYAGHIDFNVWRGTSSTDVQMDGADKLTGNITNADDFKEYYINAYNTSAGSTSITSVDDYVDFGHTVSSGKKYVDIGQGKTAAELITLFGIAPSGSLVSAPGITTTNTVFTVTGPIGKASSKTYDFINGTNLVNSKFPATTQGKYSVTYTTRFGYDDHGDPITRTETMALWVAFDDVNIYVDMNDNIGIPVLNFKYYVNSSGTVVAAGTSGATEAYLPFEMDLVTGSESIYKTTIKISKLNTDYKINFTGSNPIVINYITVENNYITTNGISATRPSTGAFTLGSDARITGEVWLKANSTKLTTFNCISCGTLTNNFLAVIDDGSTNTLMASGINSVHGTGIHTDDDDIYKALYAGSDGISNFHYVLNTKANQEVTIGNNTYYFDKWISFKTPAMGLSLTTNNDVTTVTIPSGATDYSNNPDLNFTSAPDYQEGDGDMTYIAKYKLASSSDTTVRVEITYHFQDFDTSDGNYIYDANKETVAASYTKTVKVPLGSTYANFNAVKSAANAIASANVPHVVSNYFNYAYTANSAAVDNEKTSSEQNKIVVNANLTETARAYRIVLKNAAGTSTVATYTNGYYQNTVELSSNSVSNPVWEIKSGTTWVTLGSGATGSTFKARFVSSGNENDSGDCQIIRVKSGSATAANNKSVISNSFTEVFYENATEKLAHNFYIIDYCTEGQLVGGGVLFATTDSNGNYRQTSAANNLDTTEHRTSYITGILNGDYETEYTAQTINNVGFRYKPYKNTENVYNYSAELGAYLTVFRATNVNSTNYENQKLRLFSFMVYRNGNNTVIVPSDGYAEVSRYINTAS